MTEKQAWLTIFKAYSTPRGKRTIRQHWLVLFGICSAITDISNDAPLTYEQEIRMKAVVAESMPPGKTVWFCSYPPANDPLRADWCYLQYCRLQWPERSGR